ncbi:Mov34/MPN/PAD-1 family protein [Nonomuraea sp. NPDC050404]|uniref:Mov34/MPN/PAD-1 family protein n=1 Tax=Nonomuraea sp. NPDC050404 TaxID=3155783 RepID=UPI0033CA626B
MSGQDPDFEIVGEQFDVPFRARSGYRRYIRITVDDSSSVYVDREVAARLRRHARHAAPRETGGLLAGRAFRDNQGAYLIITGMAAAPPESGGRGWFHLTPEGTQMLREELAEREASADVVGWWHSHEVASPYSSHDRANQTMWDKSSHVGLLVFAAGAPWARLHMGPDSAGEIDSYDDPGSVAAEPAADRDAAQALLPPETRPALSPVGRPVQIRERPPAPSVTQLRRLITTVAVAAGLGVVLVALLQTLRPAPGPAAAPSSAPPPVASTPFFVPEEPRPTNLSWWCVIESDRGSARCRARTEPPLPILWYLDGQIVGFDPEVTIAIRRGKKNILTLSALGNRALHEVGRVDLPER